MIATLLHYISPEYIIQTAGVAGILAAIFAETGLLVGIILPGDSLLFVAGLLVASGIFSTPIITLMIMTMVAGIAGDQVGYIIGRRLWSKLYTLPETFFFKHRYLTQSEEFYNKHGQMAIILGRFVPIMRTIVPMMAGVSHMSYRTFITYNIIGGITRVGLFMGSGYILGHSFPRLQNYIELIALVIVMVSVIPIAIKRRISRNTTSKRNS